MEKAMNDTKKANLTDENIKEVTDIREQRYGSLKVQGKLAQDLKDVAHNSSKWNKLLPYQKECIDMVMHKISRILEGDPKYIDSWRDIVGYVSRVVEFLADEDGASDSETLYFARKHGVWKDDA